MLQTLRAAFAPLTQAAESGGRSLQISFTSPKSVRTCGDYIKVEFPDETTGIGEWMWMIVDHIDDKKRLVFGTLDNEPLADYAGKVKLGSQLAVSYDNVREHKEAAEFKSSR
jgi:hypothetical protein